LRPIIELSPLHAVGQVVISTQESAVLPMTRRDQESPASNSQDDSALLRDAMGSSRSLAGGITHDLNSALQALGDALFAVRDDAQTALDDTAAGERSMATFAPSLGLADDAFHRLCSLALAVPHLVPSVAEENGPIKLDMKIPMLVSLIRHQWRNRVQILVEIDSSVGSFWCTWWVARLAILRLLMTSIEAARTGRDGADLAELPRLRITATQTEQTLEIRAIGGAGAAHNDRVAEPNDLDATLVLCVKRLKGDVRTETNAAGIMETVLRFPVLAAPAAGATAL
jgi:hypothetical protein